MDGVDNEDVKEGTKYDELTCFFVSFSGCKMYFLLFSIAIIST